LLAYADAKGIEVDPEVRKNALSPEKDPKKMAFLSSATDKKDMTLKDNQNALAKLADQKQEERKQNERNSPRESEFSQATFANASPKDR
jgi:hypothetical protein